MSRYFTFIVAKNKPMEKLKIRAYATKSGKRNISGPGIPKNTQRRMIKITKEIKKSIRHTMSDDSGIMILGKYTLVRMLEFPRMELLESLIEVEINPQMITPAETVIRRWGILSVCSINSDINPKIAILIHGLITAHRIPIKVCL